MLSQGIKVALFSRNVDYGEIPIHPTLKQHFEGKKWERSLDKGISSLAFRPDHGVNNKLLKK